MAESPKNCPACEAVIRPNAVFCHLCGRPLTVNEGDASAPETQSLIPNGLTDVFVATDAPENETALAKTPLVVETAQPVKAKTAEAVETETIGIKQITSETSNGASAEEVTLVAAPAPPDFSNDLIDKKENSTNTVATDSGRRRAKTYVSRTEYVWEEANAPTWRVILFSLIALMTVILLLWLNNILP